MKKFILITCLSLFILNNSCESPVSSVGMTSWEGVKDMKWHIGTEAPIRTVAEFEDAWKARDYDKMKSMCTDTTTFVSGDGIPESIDELIANVKRQNSVRDSIGATLTWETKQVFSVDLMPGVGGEHVHSYIDAKYTEGEAVNRFRAIQRWFVSDGKIVQQSSYWQDIDDEEN